MNPIAVTRAVLLTSILAAPVTAQKAVGLDAFHNNEANLPGHYSWDAADPGGFSELGKLIQGMGGELRTVRERASAKALAGLDVLIVVDPDTPAETAEPKFFEKGEIRAIEKWVRAGGQLALLGNDKGNTEFEHFNKLSARFGIEFIETKYRDAHGASKITVPSGSAITGKGLSAYFVDAAPLRITANESETLLSADGAALMSLVRHGKGSVLALGDPWVYNEYIGRADNRRMASNVFRHLLRAAPVPPVRLIFDTDMGNDIDDALALAMLHSLESRGEAKILAVTITKDNPFAAPYVDLVNHFYGRPAIPIGMVHGGKTPDDGKYIRAVAERSVYKRRLKSGAEAPDATALLRNVLSGEADRSVVLVQVGFSTNLARLLEAPGGAELVARKVRLISAMAGAFPSGKKEYNVHTDIAAARGLFAGSPVPIVFSGYEVGENIRYPASSIEKDYAYAADHPVAEAYRAYMKMPYDRQTWDLAAALYAVRPAAGFFSISEPGTVTVDDEGKTVFTPGVNGRHRYLTASPAQRERALEAMIELCSRRPDRTLKSDQ